MTKRLAIGRVMGRLRNGLAHERGGTENTIQAGKVDHFHDGPHTLSFFSQQRRPGMIEFNLTGSVGAIPQLLLEALNQKAIFRAIGQHTREQKAGKSSRRLSQYQEEIAHWG